MLVLISSAAAMVWLEIRRYMGNWRNMSICSDVVKKLEKACRENKSNGNGSRQDGMEVSKKSMSHVVGES